MGSLTHLFLFGLCAILSEGTFHHGLHHGMPMYGSPYMYPGMGMGMGMGMHHGGPMMYGMGPGLYAMPFKESEEAEGDINTENAETITPEKSESSIPEVAPLQETSAVSKDPSRELTSFKDVESTTETVTRLVKREVTSVTEKDTIDFGLELSTGATVQYIHKTTKEPEGVKENAVNKSSHELQMNVTEKDIPALAQNSDYVMLPVIQPGNPVLTASSQNINQGFDGQRIPSINYQNNVQNQIPMYGNQMNNNMNGVPQNYNMVPVHSVGNTPPGVLTYLTIPNNMGLQAGNVPNNQYYVNTVPQNFVNGPGLQQTPMYNVVPVNNQPQHNLIGFLAQPNNLMTINSQPNMIPINNQYHNGIPVNNQLVNVVPINSQPHNVLPANNYVLMNNPQNVEPLPGQASLNAWNVPVGNQPLNYNQQPLNYNQQPINYNQQPINYNQQPINYNQQPTNYNQQPLNYNQPSMNYHQQPANYNQQPLHYQKQNMVLLNGQPNNVYPVSNAENSLPQGGPMLNGNLAVTEPTQTLNDNSQYIPVYNTKDKVDKVNDTITFIE